MAGSIPKGVTDPATVSFLSGSGKAPAFTDLSDGEISVFDNDLKRLASLWSRQTDLGKLWLEDRDTFLWALSVAKKQLDDLEFGGLKAIGSSTMGMQVIRPRYINATQTWIVNRATTGWAASAWNVNLATTTAGAQNTQNRVVLCFTRYANYAATPKVSEIRHTIGQTTYGVEPLSWGYIGGLYLAKGIGAGLIGKNGTFTTDFNVEFTGDDGTALWGLAFAQGDWMDEET